MQFKLKKTFALASSILIIVVCFQNCDNGFDFNANSEAYKASNLKTNDANSAALRTGGHKIKSFVVERQYVGNEYKSSQKRISKITATLDIPLSPLGGKVVDIRNSDFKMIISKLEESALEKCYSTYSIHQDDIRNLLDKLTQIVILNANHEYKDISFPAVMPSVDVYSMSLNNSKQKIFLEFTPWFGPLFVKNLNLKHFIKSLDEHKDKIISSHCELRVDRPYGQSK